MGLYMSMVVKSFPIPMVLYPFSLMRSQNTPAFSPSNWKLEARKRYFGIPDYYPEIMGKYTTTPCELFRVAPPGYEKIRFREKSAQEQLGKKGYDYILHPDGLYHPLLGTKPIGPNGVPFRRRSLPLYNALSLTDEYLEVLAIPKNETLPSMMILVRESKEIFSLQTRHPISPREFIGCLNDYLKKFDRYSIEGFFEKYPATIPGVEPFLPSDNLDD